MNNSTNRNRLAPGEGITKDGVRYRLDEAYHGSGALFNRFDVNYIGTGEGAHAFGWGIYVTENDAVARDYARRLEKAPGTLITWRGMAYDTSRRSYVRDLSELTWDIWQENPKLLKLGYGLRLYVYPIQYLAEGILAGLEMDDAINNAMQRVKAGINAQASDEVKTRSVEYAEYMLRLIKRKTKTEEMQFVTHKGGKHLYTVSAWEWSTTNF